MSKDIRTKVRILNTRHDDRLRFLQKEYKEELSNLQHSCQHGESTKWEYRLDTQKEIASTAEGVLYLYSECEFCGKVQRKLDDNNYDSEIFF
jgi:hypothetical protein